ncbi:hypothetical protein ETU08_11740 [Apibacter muscae]|nr:hypothetical protein ETU08_11740 [Apibacter muscae]
MEIDIQENLTTKVGNNISTTAGQEISQYSGKKTLLHSSQSMEVEAMNYLDLYGKQKLITYTKGNAEMGALGQMHVHGTNALYSAKGNLDYKAPNMGRLAQSEKFLYGKTKTILEIYVMDKNMENRLEEVPYGEESHVFVQTRNYEEGEIITIIGEPLNTETEETYTFKGIVNKEGIAKMEKTFSLKKNVAKQKENILSEDMEIDENAIYKTYKGKDYTYQQWKDFEQKQWEYYQSKQKRKRFWD